MKKILILLSILCLSSAIGARVIEEGVEINHCEFALTNDSGHSLIYVTTNKNLASVVNKKTLKQSPNVAEIIRGGKPSKIVSNWFYVYIPTSVEGQYMQHYKVQATSCEKDPKKFKLRYTQIRDNSADSRIAVEDLSAAIGAQPKAERAPLSRKEMKQQKPKVRRSVKQPRVRENEGSIGQARPSQPEYEVYIDRKYPMGMFPGNVAPVPEY